MTSFCTNSTRYKFSFWWNLDKFWSHYLLGAGGQLDTRALGVGVVGDDGGEVAGAASELATVAGLLLQVADDGT